MGAFVVVVLVALGVWRGAAALFASSDGAGNDAGAVVTGGADDATGAGSGTPSGDGPAGAAAVVDTPPADTQPVDTQPVDTSAASASNPSKVFIVGDSDAGTFGPYLQTLLDATGIVETELDYKVSSGLARPDFFDWPAEIDRKLPEVNPDIVVATFGGNDANILRDAAGNDLFGYPESDPEGWTAEYQQRAGDVMDQLTEGGRTLIWVGIPNDDNPEITARLVLQDRAAKAAAAERPEVVFVDAWTRFSGRDGNWAEFVVDPRDGVGKDVRADDGFHLNETGAEILAIDIAQAVRDTLRDRGADI